MSGSFHRNAGETERAGANAKHITGQRGQVLTLLREATTGLTDTELYQLFVKRHVDPKLPNPTLRPSVGTRRRELRDQGLVRRAGTRPGPSGFANIVWEAIP